MTTAPIGQVLDHRCPRCGSVLKHNNRREWCSQFGARKAVGGGKSVRWCNYGIDLFVPHNPPTLGFTPYADPRWTIPGTGGPT